MENQNAQEVNRAYLVFVILLMLVLPVISIIIEHSITPIDRQSIIAELVNHDLKAMRVFQDLAFDTLKIISNKDTIIYNGQNQIINALKEENGGFFIDVN
ncbi:MAG TPA: hypothetical protein VK783_07060 [Bacteroidia bacterium]|jgi:hypothetical protein|nr:hypothetical protein [Bacteroidia bacterium]